MTRTLTAAALALCATLIAPAHAAWPEKAIRLVVPYTAGGGTDILARIIAAELAPRLGQSVVVDNRPGAATAIGTEIVAKAAPDGYTVLMTTGTFAVLPAMYAKLAFDPVKDFAAVSLFASSPNVLIVHPAVPAATLKDFIAHARSRSDPLNYGSSGNGGTGHLAMEMLKQMTGVNLVHIPYKGGAPAMTALLAGEVSAMINNIAAAVPQIKADRVRALGVTTTARSPALPAVPTLAEAGLPEFSASAWFGAFVPAATPAPIVDRLSRDIARIVQTEDVRRRYAANGVDAVGNAPSDFAATVRADVERWRRVLKNANIKPD